MSPIMPETENEVKIETAPEVVVDEPTPLDIVLTDPEKFYPPGEMEKEKEMTFGDSPGFLAFDIETVPHPEVMKWIEVREKPDPPIELKPFDIKPPANYKDPDKIAAYQETKVQELNQKNREDYERSLEMISEDLADQIAKSPLDFDRGAVEMIGVRRLGLDTTPRIYCHGDLDPDLPIGDLFFIALYENEKEMIAGFWDEFSQVKGKSIGFNILSFDFPFLMRRSFDLGIPIPWRPNLARYRTDPVADLRAILVNWNYYLKGSLKWIVERYGIYNPLPDLEGSQFGEMNQATKFLYTANDVNLNVRLFNRMKGVYF